MHCRWRRCTASSAVKNQVLVTETSSAAPPLARRRAIEGENAVDVVGSSSI
jgi:hypothetical protein